MTHRVFRESFVELIGDEDEEPRVRVAPARELAETERQSRERRFVEVEHVEPSGNGRDVR